MAALHLLTTQGVVPGRVLVRYREGSSAPAAARGAQVLRRMTSHTHLINVTDSDTALAQLRGRPDVEWAEPDYVRQRSSAITPNDEMYGLQWALPVIHAPTAWARTTGSNSVVVAIIDTGILPHPDLVGRVVPGFDFISDIANANDGDGRDPDPTDTGDGTAASSMLHGTHVAGIVGALADNHIGVAGLDWACRIQPIRVLGVQEGKGADSDIADAIRWAAGIHIDGVPDNATPADVINLSFDGRGISHAMQDAVDDAMARGAVVVAAAGNDGTDAGAYAPAGLSGIVTVGAVDESGQRAAYSNFGPTVALLAPGGTYASDGAGHSEGILSTMLVPSSGWSYVNYAGTSQAAPFVAGTVSLMKALYPQLKPKLARALLDASANTGSRCPSPDNASESGCGAGLLDVDAALALAAAQPVCGGRCGDDQMCSEGQCVPIVTNAVGRRAAGCAVSGASTGGSSPLLLWMIAGLLLRRGLRSAPALIVRLFRG
jgi:serine protease